MNVKFTTDEVTYSIKPRMKKRWFTRDIKVYDLIKYSKGERWNDPSYGNGMGNYIDYESEDVIYSFDTLMEAESFKHELEK
jgi:hypothetical protein